MARLLLTVKDVRCLECGDLALIPGVDLEAGEEFRAGDPIGLKRPDGSTTKWRIGALTLLPASRWRKHLCLVLKGLSKDDVPIGTKVWSLSSPRGRVEAEAHKLPNRVLVKVDHPRAAGLAIHLFFGMLKKNKYSYMVFLAPNGTAEVPGAELIRHFREEWSFALMDYVDPVTNFTGAIAAKVLSNEDLQGAIKVFESFRKFVRYPDGYEKNLRAAAARGQNPREFKVELTVE
jgi:hypothetical protein